MNQYLSWIFLLTTMGHLCSAQSDTSGTFEEVEEKLNLYNRDSKGKEFVKVLSWSYDSNLEKYLDDFIYKLDPTVVTIQNITKMKYEELKYRMFSRYEASGIPPQSLDDEIINPILYQGDRLKPVPREDKFSGVVTKKDFGQISWSQFFLTKSQLKNTRKKRDLPDSIIGRVFDGLRASGDETESCSIPGSMVILNANLKKTEEKPHMLNNIYRDIFCQRRKKAFLTGNVGWTKSHSAVYKFAKRMMKVNTFKLGDVRNVNMIWSYDFVMVRGIASNIKSYNGEDLTRKLSDKMIISPTFVAYHFDSIKVDQ